MQNNKNALSKLQENARLHTELVQKLQKQQLDLQQQDEGSSASEEESDEDDPTDAVTKNATPAPGVAEKSYIKMKKYWSEYNKQKEEEMKDRLEEIRGKKTISKKSVEEQAIEQADKIVQKEMSALKKKKKVKLSDSKVGERQQPTVSEYEFTFDSNKPDTPMNEGVLRLQTLEDFENLGPDKSSVSEAEAAPAAADVTRSKGLKALPEVDATKVKTLETKVLTGTKSRVADLFNDDDSDGETGEHDELFDEDDNALEEFNKQKAAAEEAAQPKDECYALPGWGEWASPDCLISKKKMEKFTIKAPKKPPVKRGNFIYNEKADLHPGIRERMTQLFNQPEIKHAVKRKMQKSSGDDQSDKNPPKKRVRRLVTFKKSIKKFSRNSVS
ncbi:Small-subunit processome Utp14 [Trinorchestia longiramus]|nr:Small-subunit processome Utp14 [Trinorchestia longiramus]